MGRYLLSRCVTCQHSDRILKHQYYIHHPGLIDEIVCTGQFLKDEDEGQIQVKLGKPEVIKCLRSIEAQLIIDGITEIGLPQNWRKTISRRLR